MTPTELQAALQNFTGTERYHRFNALMPNVLLTDGVKFLAENAGAYWLLDVIGSYLPKLRQAGENFGVARYAGTPGGSGLFSITDDVPAHETYAMQTVEFSDFPLDEIKLYVSFDGEYWVILLPGEY